MRYWTEVSKTECYSGSSLLWAVWPGKCQTYKLQFSQYCIKGNCEHENSLKMIGYSDRWGYKIRFLSLYIVFTYSSSTYIVKTCRWSRGVSATISTSNVIQGLENTMYPQVLGLMWHYFGFTISGLNSWDTSCLSFLVFQCQAGI